MSFTKLTQVLMIAAMSALPIMAQDAPAEAAPPPGMFGGNFLFIMVFMILIIYFIMIRPEQKRQKERVKMLSALKKGDRILTIGGIYGVIQTVKDTSYVIKSGEGAVLEISKSAVQTLVVDQAGKDGGKEVVKESEEQVKEKA
ncbi:MAG: preprotein translocase subunit YajC [Chitinispirillia bacterium]|nr:preprotein translocase subunit YajC [Chitinispirillia bacterium]MCL2268356.1 preprotein translocase subunit YajC [Chitinispirillia bacterium]